MNTKDELINHLKDWITIDNKILNLQKSLICDFCFYIPYGFS